MTKTLREIIRDIINIVQSDHRYLEVSYQGETVRYIQLSSFLKKLKEYREGLEE